MAKLCSCYALCPLIDRCPIGVMPDSTPECVIVTLGKNIVIRYKLADQKQASSWSCKAKLSAPVVYDHLGKVYIAVFNHSIISMWDSVEVDLNRVKKHKFEQPIHLVLSKSEKHEPVVVFKNGRVVSLSKALQSRKAKSSDHLPAKMSIKGCFFIPWNKTECVGIHASNGSGSIFLIVEVDGHRDPLKTVILERKGQSLLGLTTMQTENSVALLTFWNDGQLWSLPLNNLSSQKCGFGQHLATLSAISAQHNVYMIQISATHVALYGADPSDEGAMLVIFNTQFHLVQARQHYKLFSDKANIWTLGTSILLVVGHSLAVAPFVLDSQRLSSLIGSHQPLLQQPNKGGEVEQISVPERAVWEDISEPKQESTKRRTTSDKTKKSLYSVAPEILKHLTVQGYSQSLACESLVPSLISNKNAEALLWILQNLPDFPESALVSVISFILETPSETFSRINIDSDVIGVLEEDTQDMNHSLVDLTIGQRMLLDVVLTTPVCEAVLQSHLKSKLTLSHCLALLQYIAQSLPHTRSPSFFHALLKWGAILIDSHYQQLVLSREESITTTVLALKEIIESQVEYVDDLKALYPMLEKIKIGQSFQNIRSTASYQYCVETLRLY